MVVVRSANACAARGIAISKADRPAAVVKMRKFAGNNEFAAPRLAIGSAGGGRGCYHAVGVLGSAAETACGERKSLATTARGGGFVTRLTTTPATNDAAKAKIIG